MPNESGTWIMYGVSWVSEMYYTGRIPELHFAFIFQLRFSDL